MDTDRLKRLANQIREKEETARGMRLASLRQRRTLPNPPEIENWDFAIMYEPAAHVSGDFYDFIPLRENLWGVVVGDVSGHGVEAGIIMGMAKQTVSIFARQHESPAETLIAANAEIHRVIGGKMFVGLSYATINIETRELRFCRAGQCKPVLFNPKWKTPTPQVLDSKGLALGVDSGARFAKVIEERSLQLEPGDLFFQYTDGFPEATNKDKEQFGEARLRDVIQRYSRTSVSELLDIMAESLQDFARVTELEDDITLVGIKLRDTQQMLTTTAKFDLRQVRLANEKRNLAPPGASRSTSFANFDDPPPASGEKPR